MLEICIRLALTDNLWSPLHTNELGIMELPLQNLLVNNVTYSLQHDPTQIFSIWLYREETRTATAWLQSRSRSFLPLYHFSKQHGLSEMTFKGSPPSLVHLLCLVTVFHLAPSRLLMSIYGKCDLIHAGVWRVVTWSRCVLANSSQCNEDVRICSRSCSSASRHLQDVPHRHC